MMKKILCLILACLLCSFALISCNKEENEYVAIEVDGYGTIIARLRPDVAPTTVENFQKLVSEKFYDGLIFHRVIEDFMIQGGGFDENMIQKDADSIYGEFKANGFAQNDLQHTRGVLSMARTPLPNSASSQFFICHADSTFLDGQYAAFGEVVSGMEVVDAIATVSTDENDQPLQNIVITSIYFTTLE